MLIVVTRLLHTLFIGRLSHHLRFISTPFLLLLSSLLSKVSGYAIRPFQKSQREARWKESDQPEQCLMAVTGSSGEESDQEVGTFSIIWFDTYFLDISANITCFVISCGA